MTDPDDKVWDSVTALPTPCSDMLQSISHRLSKICLRDGGMLDLETESVSVPRQIRLRLDALKANTIALHKLVKEATDGRRTETDEATS